MIMACTGGGILVPLFINAIPVPMANDAYPIAILTSFAIHYYFPIVWEVVGLSPMVKVRFMIRAFIFMCTNTNVQFCINNGIQ